MKVSVNKYLLYSSVFAIFTEAFFFNFIIDWKLLYLIIIVNYLLLFKYRKVSVNNYFLLVITGLFIHAVITNIIAGVPPNFMISQLLGISIIGTYYYNFGKLFSRYDIIRVYTKMALIVAIIGYPMFFLNINLNDGRLQSIFKEPAHYVIVVIPACYYFFKQKEYWKFIIIFCSLILSSSSLGYIGCALMFIIPNISIRRIVYLTALLPILAIIFIYIYNEYSFFKMRVDETYSELNAINTGKFEPYTNLSSYAMISNLYVAKSNIEDHPYGTGIGSHVYRHENVYLPTMRPPEYITIQGFDNINSSDANSLLTRIVSEIGFFGFCLVIYLMYKASYAFPNKDYMAQGIFIYLLLKLFRDGHYFPPELFFFIWLLYFSLRNHKAKNLTTAI